MIALCPAISRGFDATVPIVPGLVSVDRRALKIRDLEFAVAGLFVPVRCSRRKSSAKFIVPRL